MIPNLEVRGMSRRCSQTIKFSAYVLAPLMAVAAWWGLAVLSMRIGITDDFMVAEFGWFGIAFLGPAFCLGLMGGGVMFAWAVARYVSYAWRMSRPRG